MGKDPAMSAWNSPSKKREGEKERRKQNQTQTERDKKKGRDGENGALALNRLRL